MTILTWDDPGTRKFEYGIDHGVLHLLDGTAVPWNGITSVSENENRSEQSYYLDGRKFLDVQTPGDFAGAIKAFTFPDEFAAVTGTAEFLTGIYLKDQPAQPFHLSYRTYKVTDGETQEYPFLIVTDNGDGTWSATGNGVHINDDGRFTVSYADAVYQGPDEFTVSTTGESNHYILHVLFNLMATPSDREYQTLGESLTPMEFEWALSSTPNNVVGYRPTAHVTIDSTKVSKPFLAQIEEILYGGYKKPPSLKNLQDFLTRVEAFTSVLITDNGDGTWTANGPDGNILLMDENTFEILGANVTFLDDATYTITNTVINP